jgi:hypothetical protein
MTMARTSVDRGTDDKKTILMSDLKCGEVGFIKDYDRYVLRIGSDTDARFLILSGHQTCNWYDMKAAKYNDIRRLREGEIVKMEFSK